MKELKKYLQLKHISSAALLEEANQVKLIMMGIIVIAILLFSLFVWASFTQLKERAVTYGEILPSGYVQKVQHLEGGIIKNIHVKNGDKVTKGQSLITMDSTAARSELAQLQSREISLILDIIRLKTLANNNIANTQQWAQKVIESKYNNIKKYSQIERRLREEKIFFDQQAKKQKDELSVVIAQVAQRKEELKQILEQKKVLDKHLALLTEEFEMYRKLSRTNNISRRDYLVIQREVNKAHGEKINLLSQERHTKQALLETQNRHKQLISKLHEEALEKIDKHDSELREVRYAIAKLKDRVARTNIKAAGGGIVKGLELSSGNVVQPGAYLLEIVPHNQNYIAETKLNTRDIGHVRVGDSVDVKVLTYDFARYGSIRGTLVSISATTFTDDNGKPYYKTTIKLDSQSVGRGKNKHKLLPGMTVQADIITGQKSLLQYLLKPIQRSVYSAFGER